MNLKANRHSDVVHLRTLDCHEIIAEQHDKNDSYTRLHANSNEALCGAAGTRKLVPTKEDANCRSCLSIATKMKIGIWIGDNGTRSPNEKVNASKYCYKNKRGQYSLLKEFYPYGQATNR